MPSYRRLISWLETQEKDVRNTSMNSDNRIINSYSVQGFYNTCAYGCIAAVMGKTQSREGLFTKCLFHVNRDDGDILWEGLIDTKAEIKFQVETSFKVKAMNPRIPSSKNSHAIVETYGKYFSDSLFVQTSSSKANQTESEVKESEKKENIDKSEDKSTSKNVYEQDKINNQRIMTYVLRLLDVMIEKFGKNWDATPDVMPEFMQELKREFSRTEIHINIKIFILKLLVNKPTLFGRFAKEWWEPIITYVVTDKDHGKGFHYFSRDLCTTLLSWNYVPPIEKRSMDLCSKLINRLINILPHQTSYIFHMNVRVLGALIERFSKLIYIDKQVLTQMILKTNRIDSIELWYLNSMQGLAFASVNNIPLCDDFKKIGRAHV